MWCRLRQLKRETRIKAAYLFFVGPWNSAIVRLLRRVRRNPAVAVNSDTVLEEVDVPDVAKRLEQHGFVQGLRVREDLVREIVQAFPCPHKSTQCEEAHLHYPGIRQIAFNSQIVEVARRYLGVEPIVHSARLSWTWPNPPASRINKPFHFDVADFRCLAFFLYLTDVDDQAGPHCVIEGTHRGKGFHDILTRRLTDEAATLRFGGRTRLVRGSRGTAFFEDITSWHRAMAIGRPRLILNINYVIARSPPKPHAVRRRG